MVEVDYVRVEIVWFLVADGAYWGGIAGSSFGKWLRGYLLDLRVLLEIHGDSKDDDF